MDTFTPNQLEHKAKEFVDLYRNASDEEISKMVAGMTAIIEGNEASYERMKNQKWFERIWYGITLKNKATVKEMQAKRDLLTKYTVQILVKMNVLMNEHSECIYDLYRALSVVRRDIDIVVDEVNSLARKLNEKIISVDNYYYLLNEIRNGKFNADTPLISLIDIMSLIDTRTANDTRKLVQLKETMEKMGFDFSKKVDISSFSDEILSLPEDSVGRVLLFCQSFSHRSRFLAYACSLMENYFFLWESDKRIVRESGEAVATALCCANLNATANCVVNEMFNDLKGALHDSFEFIEVSDAEVKTMTPANYFSTKTSKLLNVIMAGVVDSGKNTLINAVFGWDVMTSVRGWAGSSPQKRYSNDEDSIIIYDTDEIKLNSNIYEIAEHVNSIAKNNKNCVLWYCINEGSGRYQSSEVEFLKGLQSKGLPIIIAITECIDEENKLEDVVKEINANNGLNEVPVIPLLAKERVIRNIVIPAYGIDNLIDKTIDVAFL